MRPDQRRDSHWQSQWHTFQVLITRHNNKLLRNLPITLHLTIETGRLAPLRYVRLVRSGQLWNHLASFQHVARSTGVVEERGLWVDSQVSVQHGEDVFRSIRLIDGHGTFAV